MNTKTTVILAVLVLAGGILMFVEAPWKDAGRSGAAAQSETGSESGKLLQEAPSADQVPRIEIQVADKSAITCVRQENDWRVTAPIECLAESYIPRNIVDRCLNMTFVRRYSPEEPGAPSPVEAGLDKPLCTITLHVEGESQPREIHFGQQAPLSSNHYASVRGDEHIYVVSENVRNTFMRTLEDLRSKRIFDYGTAQEVAVSVAGAQSYELARAGDDWMIEKPVRTRAEKAKASTLVNTLRNLRAVEFVEDETQNLAPYGLDRPGWTIQLIVEKKTEAAAEPEGPGEDEDEGQDQEEVTAAEEKPEPVVERTEHQLLIGGKAGENVYARLADQPSVFTIRESTLKSMTPDLTELMAKKLFEFSKDDVERIELQVGGEHAVLQKEGSTWMLESGRKAEPIAVEDLLNTVRDLTAVNFEDRPPLIDTGLDAPRAAITLTVKGRVEPVRAVVGNPTASGKMVYVRSDNDPTTAVLRAENVETLLTRPVGYRDRQVLNFDRNSAYHIEIARNDRTVVLNRGEDGTWRMTQPVEAPADATSVSNILSDMNNLRARAVVAADSGSAQGLDEPWVRVTIDVQTVVPISPPPDAEVTATVEESADVEEEAASQPASQPATTERRVEAYTLLLSNPRGGKVYARVDDGELVYEIDPAIMENLVAELHERTVMPIQDPAEVTRFTIQRGGESLGFERIGDKWIAEADPALPIDEGKVTAALDDWKATKTSRFVSYAAAGLTEYGLDEPAIVVRIRGTDGATVELAVSGTGPADDASRSRYATRPGSNKVFLLDLDTVGKLNKSLSDFEKSD